ncbi:nitrilase-related carbon-nitrogen hydrolase, partial [Streptococcus sobrinus]
MRVSLIQMAVSFGRPQENFARVLQLLNQAVQEEPDVIVLPEMWNTGYALSDLAQLSDKEGQKTQELLSQFAREHKVALVAGSVAVQEAGQFFNRTYVYGKDGQLLSSYDKVHLFGLM